MKQAVYKPIFYDELIIVGFDLMIDNQIISS
jgi:hypothetical protein